MGWFLHNPASNGAKQTLHVQVFAVPKPEHTLHTAGAADVLP
jgi:hypothetical protein